jgi:hypothetical protein
LELRRPVRGPPALFWSIVALAAMVSLVSLRWRNRSQQLESQGLGPACESVE